MSKAPVKVLVPSNRSKQDLRDATTFSNGQANYGQCASYCFSHGHVGSAIAYNQEGDDENCVRANHIKCKCFDAHDDLTARPEPLSKDDKCRYSQIQVVDTPTDMETTFLVNDGSDWLDARTYKKVQELGKCDDEDRPDVVESEGPSHCKGHRKPFNCIDYDEVMVMGSSQAHRANLELYNKACPMDAQGARQHSYRKTDASNNYAKCTAEEFISDVAECKRAYQIVFKNDGNKSCDKTQAGCVVRQVNIKNAPKGCIFDFHDGEYRALYNGQDGGLPGDTS